MPVRTYHIRAFSIVAVLVLLTTGTDEIYPSLYPVVYPFQFFFFTVVFFNVYFLLSILCRLWGVGWIFNESERHIRGESK